MIRLGLFVVLCLATMCLCGCPLGTPRDHYRPHGHLDMTFAVSPTDDALLFNAAGTGGRDLYLLRLEDLNVLRITDSPDYEVDPSFSPDGKRIVYAAGIPGDRADHIFVMARDGTEKSQLTNLDANDTVPRFSPDGSMIVFARDKTYGWGGLAANWSGGGVICVVGCDGTGERQLSSDDVFAYAPFFTQDGESVCYFTEEGLFSVPTDGSGTPEKIGPSVMRADMSPDGKQLVYSKGKFAPDCELFVANVDGTDVFQFTDGDHGCFHPVFGRDGDQVYFLKEEWPQGPGGVPKSSIWTVRADGNGLKQIADLTFFDDPMNWKPQPDAQ